MIQSSKDVFLSHTSEDAGVVKSKLRRAPHCILMLCEVRRCVVI